MKTTDNEHFPNTMTISWGVASRRHRVGIVLGIVSALSLLLTGPWYFIPAGLLLAFLHWKLSGMQVEATGKAAWKANLIWGGGLLMSMCVITSLMVGVVTLYIPFEGKFLLNMLCSLILFAVFLAIFANFRQAVNGAVILMLIIATINGYVFMFRDREFNFLDIYSAATALEVSGQYSFLPSAFIICGWSLTALGLSVQFALPTVILKSPPRVRLCALATVALGLLALHLGSRNYLPERWRTNGSIKNGYYLNFYLGIRDAFVREPEDYSPETVGKLEQEYIPQEETDAGPNILVIMNESYCDLDVYPGELTTNISVTPFWDSLTENTIRGYALASVYGGNTANSEFEFLTGSTMAFLPGSSVPYVQYIEENAYSLAWVLKSYGYSCQASHCYHAMGWNRDQVYPLLGFEESRFLDQYPQEDLVRSYVSDREQYRMMLEMLDAQASPAFLMGVTMQNHGGYQEPQDTYDHTVTLTGELAGCEAAEQYLCLLNESDKALQELLTTLQTYPEDTIVLFFGDHQPKLELEFYETLNGGSLEDLDSQMRQYTVPFIIWANYDIEEKDLGLTSLNFLAGHLLDVAGLERTAYHKYLGALEQSIPAMNALGYWSKTLGAFVTYEEAPEQERNLLKDYEIVQYNALFDHENSSVLFFDQYLPDDPITPQATIALPTTPEETTPRTSPEETAASAPEG